VRRTVLRKTTPLLLTAAAKSTTPKHFRGGARNNPLMATSRHWKSSLVLPTFRHHHHWRLFPVFPAKRAQRGANVRLDMPIWMKC